MRLKKSEVEAICDHATTGRVAVLDPFSGKVIKIIHTSSATYEKPKFDIFYKEDKKFHWERCIVSKHGAGNNFWCQVKEIEHCVSSCPPLAKFEEGIDTYVRNIEDMRYQY